MCVRVFPGVHKSCGELILGGDQSEILKIFILQDQESIDGKKTEERSMFKFRNKSMTHTATTKRFLLILSICALCKLENESLLSFSN